MRDRWIIGNGPTARHYSRWFYSIAGLGNADIRFLSRDEAMRWNSGWKSTPKMIIVPLLSPEPVGWDQIPGLWRDLSKGPFVSDDCWSFELGFMSRLLLHAMAAAYPCRGR
jgi:hypothetical protein